MVKQPTINKMRQKFRRDVAFLSNLTRKWSKDMTYTLTNSSKIAQQLGDMKLAELLDNASVKFEEFLKALKKVENYAKQGRNPKTRRKTSA